MGGRLVGRRRPGKAPAARREARRDALPARPGDSVVYHFHHGWEELLIVLGGRPTLRTSAVTRELAEGAVVHFPLGPAGAHGLRNETDDPVRYVMVSTLGMPEVAEYPDLGKITAQAEAGSQTGESLWLIHDVDADAKG